MAKDVKNLEGLRDIDLNELKDAISENLLSRIEELQMSLQRFEDQLAEAPEENREYFESQLEGIREQRDDLIEELRQRELDDSSDSAIRQSIDNIMDQIRNAFNSLTGSSDDSNQNKQP